MDFEWLENEILLHALNDSEKKILKEVFEVKEFEFGDHIINQGDTEKAMYIIRSGTATVSCSLEGKKTYLGSVYSGGIVGEMSFLREQPASATVYAMAHISAYKITRDSYCKLLVLNQEIVLNLLSYIQSYMAESLVATNQRLSTTNVDLALYHARGETLNRASN